MSISLSSLVNRDITDTIIKMTRLQSIKEQTNNKNEAKIDTKSEVSWSYRPDKIVEGQFQVANPAVTTCLSLTTSTDSKILYIDDEIEASCTSSSEQASSCLVENLSDPNEIIHIKHENLESIEVTLKEG